LIFYIWNEFEYEFGVNTYIPVIRVLKSEITKLNQSRENSSN